jgi:hypothetical protein
VNRFRFPFRLGTTSYIQEADLLTNARFLADHVDDMEVFLFHTPTASNLPDEATVQQLAQVGRAGDLTYTVHLPGVVGPAECTDLALRVIHLTLPLQPRAYVLHLNNPALPLDVPSDPFAPAPDDLVGNGGGLTSAPHDWLILMRETLDRLAEAVGGHEHLCVENLSWPPELFLPLVEQLPISLCIDIGHFWLRERDPLPFLESFLPRTRVIHLHGCPPGGEDHQPLAATPRPEMLRVLESLQQYDNVLTMEIFGMADFTASKATMYDLWREVSNDKT